MKKGVSHLSPNTVQSDDVVCLLFLRKNRPSGKTADWFCLLTYAATLISGHKGIKNKPDKQQRSQA